MNHFADESMSDRDFSALEQAAEWFALLQSGNVSEKEHAAWRAWLDEAPLHRTAWQRIEAVGARFQNTASMGTDRAALAETLQSERKLRNDRRRVLRGLGVLVGCSLIGLAAWRHTPFGGLAGSYLADYRTAVGERRAMRLADGTRLWLNTASAIDVAISPTERRVSLLRGEVLIDTATDARPFFVDSPQGVLRALGTRFMVRIEDTDAKLAVYDGAVEIITAEGRAQQIVPAGQQTRFAPSGIAQLTTIDQDDTGWIEGRLVANDIWLAEFIAELQRYHRGYIHLDPAVADLRVMGTFPTDDTDHALAMLQQALPISVQTPLPWWTTIKAE